MSIGMFLARRTGFLAIRSLRSSIIVRAYAGGYGDIPEDIFFPPGVAPKRSSPSTSSPSITPSNTNKNSLPLSLNDAPPTREPSEFDQSDHIDWSKSFLGLGSSPFSEQAIKVLNSELDPEEVEITPDGLLFLPEIKYRRILNKAFGPGGWGLAPRSETIITDKSVTREYALICEGRLVSIARGEQDYFQPQGIPTATEGCKSNAMMRCCKDLGIASELWDPKFIRTFKKKYCEEKFVEHVVNKKKRKLWKRKDASWEYPYKASTF